jgi:hypothetical protein
MPSPEISKIAAELAATGFARRDAGEMERRVAAMLDWQSFAASWDDLGLDLYMADGGRYRRRRHAVFTRDREGLSRQPHRAHYQSRDYNTLNGGIARWFEPVKDKIAAHPILQVELALAYQVFNQATPHDGWEIELHQFRITAAAGGEGRPTPEGMHRDGVDFVMVMLVRRENVQSGETMIEDTGKNLLGSFTLTHPMDATFVDDHRVLHGVTPIVPIDPDRPAWRDVLVATFRRV